MMTGTKVVSRVSPIEAVLIVLGLAAISVGAALVSLPAGIILAGIGITLFGLLAFEDGKE